MQDILNRCHHFRIPHYSCLQKAINFTLNEIRFNCVESYRLIYKPQSSSFNMKLANKNYVACRLLSDMTLEYSYSNMTGITEESHSSDEDFDDLSVFREHATHESSGTSGLSVMEESRTESRDTGLPSTFEAHFQRSLDPGAQTRRYSRRQSVIRSTPMNLDGNMERSTNSNFEKVHNSSVRTRRYSRRQSVIRFSPMNLNGIVELDNSEPRSCPP